MAGLPAPTPTRVRGPSLSWLLVRLPWAVSVCVSVCPAAQALPDGTWVVGPLLLLLPGVATGNALASGRWEALLAACPDPACLGSGGRVGVGGECRTPYSVPWPAPRSPLCAPACSMSPLFPFRLGEGMESEGGWRPPRFPGVQSRHTWPGGAPLRAVPLCSEQSLSQAPSSSGSVGVPARGPVTPSVRCVFSHKGLATGCKAHPTSRDVILDRACQTRGLRATCGPQGMFLWPRQYNGVQETF